MAVESQGRLQAEDLLLADRRDLLSRIASSPAFQKSQRSREFLLYVGTRCLTDSPAAIREQEIGVEVFGRSSNYDTSQDTIVRVQGSQLRKRLQQFFSEEGRDEPWVVEMPKGSYSLSFHPREQAPDSLALGPSSIRRALVLRYLSWGLFALALISSLFLLYQNADLRHRIAGTYGPRPYVNRFWNQLFGNGRPSHLILADVGLLIFQDAMKQMISLSDYQNKRFPQLAEAHIENPETRALILNALNRNSTTLADAGISRRISFLFSTNLIPLDVVLARDATTSMVASANAILLGSRRANPWLSLYEDKLNFQTVFNETPRTASFSNRKPLPGERPEYRCVWSQRGYCRVAYLPSTKEGGNVLLISGTDVTSTDAGGEFITSEYSVRKLRESLHLQDQDPIPYFELLLETEIVNTSISQFRLIAVRRK
ncbi:MAG: hypothetical protein HY821_24325 [Acidobacteria bacterium]|nr:hypothetical protein [Acidobacteriota bacterium]